MFTTPQPTTYTPFFYFRLLAIDDVSITYVELRRRRRRRHPPSSPHPTPTI